MSQGEQKSPSVAENVNSSSPTDTNHSTWVRAADIQLKKQKTTGSGAVNSPLPEASPVDTPYNVVAERIKSLDQFMGFVLKKEDMARDRKDLDDIRTRLRKGATNDEASKLVEAYTKLRKIHTEAPTKIVDKLLEILGKMEEEERRQKPNSRNLILQQMVSAQEQKKLREMALELGEDPEEVVA